jgi:cellulose synthase/poly-beta-1,6-N-acetylglucosamine synthase-like glycosyltransferase
MSQSSKLCAPPGGEADGVGHAEHLSALASDGEPIPMRVTVLIAAHDEEESIRATLESCLNQTRPADRVVVAADNCTDRTVEIARSIARVDVFETVDNTHKKSGALNQGWYRTRACTDLYITIDADTILPPNAIADWAAEFADPKVAGVSAKFTMMTPEEVRRLAESGEVPTAPRDQKPLNFRERCWVRVQKFEFSRWTDTALRRRNRWTSVLAGTACAIRASALEEVVQREGWEEGPWTYESAVEDFYLTYCLRRMGYECRVSADVRAYTGAMLSLKTLWRQRLKWQVGTAQDLKRIGFNRQTALDWYQQGLGLVAAWMRVAWVLLLVFDLVAFHHIYLIRFWWVFPLLFVLLDVRDAFRVPHRTWTDVLMAALLIPQEIFSWIRAAWFTWSWVQVLSGRNPDLWAAQIAAERG